MRYFFLIIAVLFPGISSAQLSSPGSGAVRYTSYPSAPSVKDPVFIYCNTSGSQTGVLNAVSPGGNGPFNFSWYRWNDITKSFSDFIKNDPGIINSSINNLGEGGYKVIISGGFDTSLVGWIFIDKPFALAALQNRTCDYVALKGMAVIDTFYYKNLSNGDPVKLPNAVKFMWSSDPTSTIPYPDLEINPQTFDPPLVDVTYKLQVSDSFGCISESSFFYESIHVKADFSVDPDKGEAPLEVAFTDKSIRGFKYLWEFGDGSKDSISELRNPEPHIYYKPGEYSVILTVTSEKYCTDSMRFEKIVVDPSELKIPNVFTPDGDGLNDNFIVESKSLRYISVEVFSRSGLKVYAFYGEGESLRAWKGWDGNINNSSVKASPGVYFYIIHAYGWDNVNYNSKEEKGFVYLYR
ncbi:MAG: PKD domain-containing protein [Bacteroidetes bacterium]|nr:MAG: PKD domain-containing protein [Bacteroidota bacterium]